MVRILVPALVCLALLGCKKSHSSSVPKEYIVGGWSGSYQNPGDTAGARMEFEFFFREDGTFKMGKRKVWFKGTYRFIDDNTFEVKIAGMPAGPYTITEAKDGRLVYERKMEKGGVQKTALTRQ